MFSSNNFHFGQRNQENRLSNINSLRDRQKLSFNTYEWGATIFENLNDDIGSYARRESTGMLLILAH